MAEISKQASENLQISKL